MVVKLQGGLGNQMFQFAYGHTRGAKFDRSGIVYPRTYALDPFHLPIEFDEPADTEGYWQGEQYFDNERIRKLFSRERPIYHDTVAVHVRLTDNLSERALAYHGNLLDTDYYDRAMEYVRHEQNNAKFLVFSDDSELAKKLFKHKNCYFLRTGEPVTDLWMMAQCSRCIIANSSYSWWGAWLGRQELVIAPKRWFVVDPPEDCKNIVPDRWVKL